MTEFAVILSGIASLWQERHPWRAIPPGPGENEAASVPKTPDMVPSPLEDVLEANAGGEMALDNLMPTGEGDGASGSLGEKDLTKGLGDEGGSEPRASGDGPGVIPQEASGDSLLVAEAEVPEGKASGDHRGDFEWTGPQWANQCLAMKSNQKLHQGTPGILTR